MPDITPKYLEKAFRCPHCGSNNQQDWYRSSTLFSAPNSTGIPLQQIKFSTARCAVCHEFSIWDNANREMVYPDVVTVPLPHSDMPEEIAKDYQEARSIAGKSARGAAALLRLATEKLARVIVKNRELSGGGDLNGNIKLLVANGLHSDIQRALDSLRVIGNEAVHPGVLDLRDDKATAEKLFQLLNLIVQNQISEPALIQSLYEEKVPPEKKDGIEQRDKANKTN